MSDKLSSSVLDGLTTRPLSDFSNLKPDSFKAVQIAEESFDKKMMPLSNPEIKVVKSKEYEKSVNEVVKNVVVRAKVEVERSNNKDNILEYNKVIDYALDNQIISHEELDAKYQKFVLKENNSRAEAALKLAEETIAKVESTLQKLENFEPEEFSEIYFVGFELQGLLELNLDRDTKTKVSHALDSVRLVIAHIEKKVDKNLKDSDAVVEFKNPFLNLGNLFRIKNYF